MSSEYELTAAPNDLSEESEKIYAKLSQVVDAVAKSMQFIVESELNRAQDGKMAIRIRSCITAYQIGYLMRSIM